MKTLTEIKNEYARERGYEDWNDIRNDFRDKLLTLHEMTIHEREVCLRSQKLALEKAVENLSKFLNTPETQDLKILFSKDEKAIEFFRTSIINEINLIR